MITSDHEIGVFVISSTAELPCLNFRIRDLHSVASICATELGSSQTPFFIALGLAPIQPFTAAALSAEGPCACDAPSSIKRISKEPFWSDSGSDFK
jgi:hypothetical protein